MTRLIQAHNARSIEQESTATDSDPSSLHPSADGLIGNPQTGGYFVGTLSGDVSADEIVLLTRREVKMTHVFTLQTVSGLYNNNGIICRNCKCIVIPVISRFDAGPVKESEPGSGSTIDRLEQEYISPTS